MRIAFFIRKFTKTLPKRSLIKNAKFLRAKGSSTKSHPPPPTVNKFLDHIHMFAHTHIYIYIRVYESQKEAEALAAPLTASGPLSRLSRNSITTRIPLETSLVLPPSPHTYIYTYTRTYRHTPIAANCLKLFQEREREGGGGASEG